jgi:hypothetical protein
MSEQVVCVKSFSSPDIDRREVLRYAGIIESSEQTEALLSECIREAETKLSYKACWREYKINHSDDGIDLGFTRVKSTSLERLLDGCDRIILFCASVGVDMDRLIARYSLVSPSRSVMLQALGSERVEALCDSLCEWLADEYGKNGCSLTRRFSPGYADLPLELQRDVFAALECSKMIGVSLGDKLFMTPSKSVTAIIGIKNVN